MRTIKLMLLFFLSFTVAVLTSCVDKEVESKIMDSVKRNLSDKEEN